MNYRNFVYILTMCLVSLGQVVIGQSTDNSPYSRLGIGDLTNTNLNGIHLMGGLGNSFVSSKELNVLNPASYGFLDYTVFDVGLYGKYSQLSDSKGRKANVGTGNLEYFSLGFPLRNINNEIFDRIDKPYKWGMNLTIKPFSTVNYNIKTTEYLEGVGNVTREFEGNGGTYAFTGGTGFRYKNFGVGVNLGYVFGNISNEQYINVDDDLLELEDEILNEYSISGFTWNAGVIYKLALNKKEISENKSATVKSLLIGLQGKSANNFSTNRNYSHIGKGPNIRLYDTLAYVQNELGKGKLPAELGVGLTYLHGKKASFGVDFSTAFWNQYKNEARPEQSLNQSYRISVGGTFLPDVKGFGNILERSIYKWGIYYKKDPRSFNNNILTNYGVTLGTSLPFYYQKSFSRVNLCFDLGRRLVGDLLKENYVQLKIGINFNDDQWFLKTRYN